VFQFSLFRVSLMLSLYLSELSLLVDFAIIFYDQWLSVLLICVVVLHFESAGQGLLLIEAPIE